jgi:hypothetical protein
MALILAEACQEGQDWVSYRLLKFSDPSQLADCDAEACGSDRAAVQQPASGGDLEDVLISF